MHMGEKFRQLNWEDRIKLESLLIAGNDKKVIADTLECHISTIYREIKRGTYEHLNSDYTVEKRYSADLAQEKYEAGLQNRGVDLKIGKDYALADYIEEKIVEEDYSPDAVIGYLSRPEHRDKFQTHICTKTLYNYIDKGVFLRLTNKDLPVKCNKEKRSYHKVKRRKRALAGKSISERPKDIETREEFGHWEMDSVVGPQGTSKCTLIVLTERKTRNEYIFKAPDHTSNSVVRILNKLEKQWGKNFSKVFRTITVDNGTEFSDCKGMEKALRGRKRKRTDIYYCHPYSSWERASNENQNRFVRRKVRKGRNFDNKPQEEITAIQDWMNHYPRRMFQYRSSADLFREELEKLGLTG